MESKNRADINDRLHEYALLELFDRMPLQDIVEKIDKVCTRWAGLQRSALCRRREFTLLVGTKTLFYLEQPFEVQVLKTFEGEPPRHIRFGHDCKSRFEVRSRPANLDSFTALCNRMVTHMPNITKLHVSLGEVPAWTLQSVVALLTSKWSSQLERLMLFFKFDQVPQEDTHQWNVDIAAFFEAINKMPRLRDLSISIDNVIFGGISKSIDLPILSRLERFCFCSLDPANIIYESLKKYAQPNQVLKQIKLNSPLKSAQVEQFLQVRAQLAMRVKLHLFCDLHQFELKSMAAHFSSLTSLGLISKLSLDTIANSLRTLKQLLCLRMHLNIRKTINKLEQATENLEEFFQAQLPHIKTLILCTNGSKSHKEIKVMLYSATWFFPRMKRLEVVANVKCSICKVGPNSSNDDINKCCQESINELDWTKKLKLFGFYMEQNY